MKFHVVVTGKDCFDTMPRAVMSVARQDYEGEFDICIVDNGSEDADFTFFVKEFARKQGFEAVVLHKHVSTPAARVAAREKLDVKADDVLVFLSAYQYFPDLSTLSKLAELYGDKSTTVTYGDVFSHKGSVCYTEETMYQTISKQYGRTLADFGGGDGV